MPVKADVADDSHQSLLMTRSGLGYPYMESTRFEN